MDRTTVSLGIIGVLGLALRLVAIDSRGLWGDEAWRVWAARLPDTVAVLRVAWAQPPSAPLYWLGLHAWIGIFGHGDVAVRLFSVPAAVGALVAIYWLGRIVADRATGLAAAGLLAVSPLAVEVGQEATMYAWALLLATLALAAGLHWRATGRGRTLYILLGVLLLYTHYMGALFLALLCLVGLPPRGRRAAGSTEEPEDTPQNPDSKLKTQNLALSAAEGSKSATAYSWLGAHAIMGLLWAPWLGAMGLRLAARWDEVRQLQHRADLGALYDAAATLSVAASAAGGWAPPLVAGAVLAGGALAGWGLAPRPGPRSVLQVWWPGAVAAGFVGITVAVSALTGAWVVQPRFLALVLPAALLAPAAGLGRIIQAARVRSWPTAQILGGLLGVGWLLAQAGGLHAFYVAPVHGRDGLREIGARLQAEVQPGDLVVSNHPLLLWSVAQYYDGPARGLPISWDVRAGYPLLPPVQPAWVQQQLAALAPLLASAPRLWLIYLPAVDPAGRLLAAIQARYGPGTAHAYPYATLYQFASPNGPRAAR